MLIVFVHGWGVRTPDYGSLPVQIRRALRAQLFDIWLSEYISSSDEVTMDDLAAAFERARLTHFPDRAFACVTHSAGGPVIRTWLDRFSGPLTALVMLAPPNHGSALAQLGKGRLSRLKTWMEGVEPGQRILDWLELGSEESWALNIRWLDSHWPSRLLVLTGSHPDASLYDHLNSYTGERGSDGVVRLAAANLNYSWMRLHQVGNSLELAQWKRSLSVQALILSGASHRGILTLQQADHPSKRASMVIFKVVDTSGHPVEDFDLVLTAGPAYCADALPPGFFIDRQRNSKAHNTLTYFVDHAAMMTVNEFGFVVTPRPITGPIHYSRAEFCSTMFLRAHETTMIEIVLDRHGEDRLFQLKVVRDATLPAVPEIDTEPDCHPSE
jgi:pimeloyl-ACP methyl ester carboxylesterase